jgi:selenocysteine lyase/cysteine desulfurase
MNEFDTARWRRDTPAVAAGRVHLNNAGAALMPQPVLAAVFAHLRLESEIGGYEAADAARADIQQAYADVAALVGAAPRNIAFVESATAAFQQALGAFDLGAGDTILTSRNDYISNQLMYLSLQARRGVGLTRVEDLAEGGVDPDAVRASIARHRPALVALTWVPTNSGLVQRAAEVGRVCADAGVPFMLDACQAVGQFDVDVRHLHCDYMAATSRKFLRGPRGAGFLYVADAVLERGAHPLLLDMRGAEWTEADRFSLAAGARRFETWEHAPALVLGTGAAARYAADVGVDAAGEYAAALADYARARLADLPGARVLDRGERRCAIVTVAFDGHDANVLVAALRDEAINTSATLPELAVLDMDEKRATSAVRISPHYYNLRREIDLVVGALEDLTRPA